MPNQAELNATLLTVFQSVGQTMGLTVSEMPPADETIQTLSVRKGNELVGMVSVATSADRASSTTTKCQDNRTISLASLWLPVDSETQLIEKLGNHALKSMFAPSFEKPTAQRNHLDFSAPSV